MERAGTELASENPAIPSKQQYQFAESNWETKLRGAFALQGQEQLALNHFQPLEFDREVLLSTQPTKGDERPRRAQNRLGSHHR